MTPCHIISIRRHVQKTKHFDHFEFAGIPEAANWLDYFHETQGDIDMHEESTPSIREIASLQSRTYNLVPTAKKSYTPS